MTYRQRLFVAYYLGESRGNATDAARRAGYPHPNMSGPRLMVNDGIRAAIDAKLASVAMTQEEILARLAELAGGDIGKFIVIDGDTWKFDIRKVKRSGRLVRKIKATKDGTELELEPKVAALVKLGEYYGMWNRCKPIPDAAADDGNDEERGVPDDELDGWAAERLAGMEEAADRAGVAGGLCDPGVEAGIPAAETPAPPEP